MKLSDTVIKVFFQILAVLIAFIPSIFFFSVKALLSPVGFWQNFVVYGVGLYVLGAIQLVLLFVLVGVSLYIWTEL